MTDKLLDNAQDKIRLVLSRKNPYEKPSIIKQACLTCPRILDELDIILGGICPYCAEERVRNVIESFRPVDTTKQHFPECAECHQEIYVWGMKLWDTGAKSFKLVCTKCGERQVNLDRQYRDTPWGWTQNLK